MTTAADIRDRTRVQLCGRLSVELDGEERADRLRGRQVRLLFAYLVLHRERSVARDELAEAMWPDSAPRSQDAALRTLLSRLRSALGADAVVGRDDVSLALPEPVWIDTEAAGAQVAAALAALDRGDARAAWALAQVPLNIAARGLLVGVRARWAEPSRRELADLRLQALEVIGRAGLELGGGSLGSAQRAGRSIIELEPYRESGYVLLMQGSAAAGNVAEGLRVYERLRALLRDELGTTPSAAAIAAHERLLHPGAGESRDGAVSAGAAGAAGRSRDGGDRLELPAGLRPSTWGALVGRRHELSVMRDWWRDGDARMLLLAGDAGTGKSRLSAALAAEVHAAGALVLAGTSPEETLAPYQPFLESIGAYAHAAPLADLRAAVRRSGDAAADVARLVPEIGRRLGELPAPAPGDPETDRYRLFEAVAALLAELAAAGPLLLVLDDLQWGGRPTLLLVRHLLRSPQAGGLRLLGARRLGEDGSEELAALLAPLRREGLVAQMTLRGLPPADAAALVRARAGGTPSAALQAALYAETDGNPFFIEEVVRHLRESGLAPAEAGLSDLRAAGLPDDVRELIARRLARLSADGRELLRGAAVIGRDFEVSLLEQVLGLEEDRFLDALEEALRARLLVDAPGAAGSYRFSHALVRETLYASTSAARRARAHHRVGRALERERDGDARVAALAHHFTRGGGDDDRAITYALAAGAEATAVLAHEEAADHYARALDVLQRVGTPDPGRRVALLLELAEARLRGGERVEAWPAFAEAAELAGRLDDREALIRAALGASRRFIQPPGVVEEELIEMLTRALQATAGELTVRRVRLLTRLCAALYFSASRDEMHRCSAEATSIAGALGDPEATALAAAARRRAWWGPGRLDRRLADSTMLLGAAGEAGDAELGLQAHAWLVVDLLEAGDRTAAQAQVEAFAAGAESLRQPLYTWTLLVWRAMLALLDGRLADAEALADEAIAHGIRPEPFTSALYHLVHLQAIRREQDRGAELVDGMRAALARQPGRSTSRTAGLALLRCDIGDSDAARAYLAGLVGADGIEVPADGDWLATLSVLAEVAAEVDDAGRAQILYDALRPHAAAHVVVGVGVVCWGSVSRLLGRLAHVAGLPERALEHLERAIEAHAALRAPVQLAHAQVDLARALGGGPRAAELLAAARETSRRLDLALVARRAANAERTASATR